MEKEIGKVEGMKPQQNEKTRIGMCTCGHTHGEHSMHGLCRKCNCLYYTPKSVERLFSRLYGQRIAA